jgi:hypothetical protein
VTATTTSAAKLGLLAQLGAEGIVMDGLDAASVGVAGAAAGPDAIVYQITGLSEAHAGKRPGAWDEQLELVRKRLFPLVGGGTHQRLNQNPASRLFPLVRGGTGYVSWGCMSTTPRALPSWQRSRTRRGVQHRRRRAGPRQRVASVPRGVRRGQAAATNSRRGWPGCWPARWRWAW